MGLDVSSLVGAVGTGELPCAKHWETSILGLRDSHLSEGLAMGRPGGWERSWGGWASLGELPQTEFCAGVSTAILPRQPFLPPCLTRSRTNGDSFGAT